MTIKRLFITVAIAVVASLECFAADYAALRQKAEASQAMVTSPSAPCNKQAETFAEFLVHFTTDKAFNAQRSKIAEIFALSPVANYRALVVTAGNDAGYCQIWQDAGPDSVTLSCGFAGAPADYNYLFHRRDGKWFLTDRITPDF